MVSWCKKGEDNTQISPKSELCGFKWANTHNKFVHDSHKIYNRWFVVNEAGVRVIHGATINRYSHGRGSLRLFEDNNSITKCAV